MNAGVDGISVRRVAADLGITTTAIYRHFADESALIVALADEGRSILDKNMRRRNRAMLTA